MKNARQIAIIDLISKKNIFTQQELVDSLIQMGFSATQATVSRDIKALGLVRESLGYVQKKYSLMDNIISTFISNNIIVIKTKSGMAMAIAALIDSMEIGDILGTIAGDDTIFCVIKANTDVKKILECFL